MCLQKYTELHVTTNFSFLRGASHPEEIVEQAATYGYSEIAITDRNTFAGIVRAHVAAKKFGVRIIPGCRLDLIDGPSLLAFPSDKNAYARISSLLTTGNLRTEKGKCDLNKTDVYKHSEGTRFVVIPPASLDPVFDFDLTFKSVLEEYREFLVKNFSLRHLGHIAETIQKFCTEYSSFPISYVYQWLLLTMCTTITLCAGNCRM